MNTTNRLKDSKTKKKLTKTIKNNLKTPLSKEVTREGDAQFLKSVKAKYAPKKAPSKAKINKKIATQLKKYRSKHAKRTTPGELIGQNEATPPYANIEGVRWNKVVVLQNKVGSKRLSKKSLKLTNRERNTYRKAQ